MSPGGACWAPRRATTVTAARTGTIRANRATRTRLERIPNLLAACVATDARLTSFTGVHRRLLKNLLLERRVEALERRQIGDQVGQILLGQPVRAERRHR